MDKGKLIAAEAEKTKSEVNKAGIDINGYNLFTNNCDINTGRCLKAGGIEIYKGDMIPNVTYDNIAEDIREGNVKSYENMKHIKCLINYLS